MTKNVKNIENGKITRHFHFFIFFEKTKLNINYIINFNKYFINFMKKHVYFTIFQKNRTDFY